MSLRLTSLLPETAGDRDGRGSGARPSRSVAGANGQEDANPRLPGSRAQAATHAPRVLVVRLEPADYMLSLVRALRSVWPGQVDAVFISPSMTQDWSFDSTRSDIGMLPAGALKSISRLWSHIRATRPALVHVAGWGAPQTMAAILLGSARRLPVVVDLDTWQGSRRLSRAMIKRVVLPTLFRRVTHFAPGGQLQAAYLRHYGVPSNRITPVNMTVDVAQISNLVTRFGAEARQSFRAEHGLPADAVVALSVGRLVPLKGVDTLLAAWSRVRSRAGTARLVLVGDGEMRDMARAAADNDPTIRVVGRLPSNETWRAYAAADIFVGASRFDNWGLVVNEAMSASLPVVLTDAYGCVQDLVRPGETGLVVPRDDPATLAGALESLIADDTLRLSMAAHGRALIADWTIESQAENIARVWSKALGQQDAIVT